MPRILVVMPVYNAENTIRKAIESILNQSHKDLVLTIVDDNSTDNSLKIAQEFLSDSRVSIYKFNKNMGAYHARNLGLYVNKDFEWDYFTTHDSDDVSMKHRYAKLIEIFSKEKVVAVQDIFERQNLFTNKSLGQSVTMAHAIFKRSVFNKVGYFDSSTRFAGDWEHWQRVKIFAGSQGLTTAICQQKLGISYVHNANLTVIVPIDSEPRKKYVDSANKKIESILKNNKFYYSYKVSSKQYEKIKRASVLNNATNVKLAVVLLTWQRLSRLPETLKQLSNQKNQNFDLYISNGNLSKANKIDSIVSQFSGNMQISVRHDGNDFYSFRRLLVAKDLYKAGYNAVIFIDDDVSFPPTFISECLVHYRPQTYQSWYAWKFDGSGEYYGRKRVTDVASLVDYGGAGVSMLDLSLFKLKVILDAPKEAYKIEDLWMSYVVSNTKNWSLRYLPLSNIVLAGADKVALHKEVQSSEFTKTDFLQYLIKRGWKIKA
jgi:GT2 family glycosyltransferase